VKVGGNRHFNALMRKTLLLIATSGLLPLTGQAAVTSSLVINPGTGTGHLGGTGDAGQDASVTTSLITTGQASLAGPPTLSRPPDIFTTAGLNNGTASVADTNGTLTFFGNMHVASATITFDLSQAYHITSVVSLAGWQDTFFGSQIFTLYIEQNDSGVFNQLGGVFSATPYTPTAPAGFPEVPNQDFSTKVTVFDDSATYLATNVTAIRFTFQDPYPTFNGGGAPFDGTVIRELSVFGVVPEPTSAMLGMAGLMMGLCRRKRRGAD
jgi:hypothetical protein